MSSRLIDEANLTATANAIREKLGSSSTYTPAQFAAAISAISSGLEYETGTYAPIEDTPQPTISFAKAHAEPPVFVAIADDDVAGVGSASYYSGFVFFDIYRLLGHGVRGSSSAVNMGVAVYLRDANATGSATTTQYATGNSTIRYNGYYATNEGFSPHTNSTTIKYGAGRTYKWIAVWKP